MSTTASASTPAVDPTTGPDQRPPATAPVGHDGARVDVEERTSWAVNGFFALLIGLLLTLSGIGLVLREFLTRGGADPRIGVLAGVVILFFLAGLLFSSVTVVAPGQTKVLQFFGRYVGTTRTTGLSMVLPFTTKRSVSVRVNNFETNNIKVNDAGGNPVEVGAIVVWQVADTARATFSVEDYVSFVHIQAEAALRHVTGSHPYDDYNGTGTSLRGSTDQVSAELAHEVAERVAVAGVEVLEVRISHLAYAPEIAQAMLQRQQASAVVAARSQIVEGAVGMVQMALAKLETEDIVDLDDERRATMVSNLLVVLCGESKTQPVINTGSLYA